MWSSPEIPPARSNDGPGDRGIVKIGVILDGATLARWQAEGLETLADEAEFVVYSCTTPPPATRRLRHAFYYLLNLFTVRNRMTRRVSLPSGLRIVRICQFAAVSDGRWQSLPRKLLDTIAGDRPAVLVKFGMGLLRVPPAEQLAVPILSFHHGNPAEFRGRPAAFYELDQGRPVVGQVVQILSDRLDCGRIAAAAETKALAHSYRATLVEAYRHSPLLLAPAIRAAVAGTARHPAQSGPAYSLPGNWMVTRFVFARFRAAVAHVLYGLTYEKRWSVATAPAPNRPTVPSLTDRLADESSWTAVPTPPGSRFVADPFFHPDGGLLVEAMSAASGRGVIVYHGAEPRRLSRRGGHFSYPAVVDRWLVPETSDWSPTMAFPLADAGLGEPFELAIPGRPRLLDPTPFRHGAGLFVFGNVASEGPSVLRLWFADTLEGQFEEHPASPIRISPNGARMAGIPIVMEDGLVRVGQDLRRGYGDGITFFRVTRLDRQHYEEEEIGMFRFANRRGPHTLNLGRGGDMAFDHYVDSFSLLAGLRRWKERRAARRIGD